MKKHKRNRPIIDWIQLDSKLEAEIYMEFKNKTIHKLPWLEELKWYRIINPRADSYKILDKMSFPNKKFRELKYTPDFIIQKWKEEIILEVKSSWTASKSDYRLRLKVFLSKYKDKLKFAELIMYNKKKYELIKYY